MFCVNCGREIRDGSKFCPHCGAKSGEEIPVRGEATQVVESKSAREVKKEQKAALKAEREAVKAARKAAKEPVERESAAVAAPVEKPGGMVGSVIISILLVIVSLLTVPAFFVKGFGEEVSCLFGSFAGQLLGSVLPGIFAGVILLMLVVDLFIVNRRRVRRAFLCGGIAFAVTGVGSVALGVFMPLLVTFFGDKWQRFLIPLQKAFCSTEMFLGLCIFVFGVLWTSIYACIGAVKQEGGKAA